MGIKKSIPSWEDNMRLLYSDVLMLTIFILFEMV